MNVPTIEPGSARLGISVAETFRRKTKMTRMTSVIAMISVSLTSCTDSRIVIERSLRTSSVIDAGSCSRIAGSSALIASTICTTLTPGCFWIDR